MRIAALALACATSAFLAACGEKTGPVSDVTPETTAPADLSSTAEPAAAAPTGACTSGFLPETGLCADPAPDLFIAINTGLQPFDPACVWKTVEVPTSDTTALLFRTQDCSAKGWEADAFRWTDGSVWAGPASLPDDPDIRSLTVFDLPPGETADQAALATLSTAPPEQRDNCIVQERPGVVLAGRAFELAPTPELLEALEAANPGDLFDACGAYGLTDSVQIWEARPTRALFHSLGQDDPMWDPASYTFYVKGGDGVWRKDG